MVDAGHVQSREFEDNAGKDALGRIPDISRQSYQDVFDTNVLGVLFCLKHEFRVMKERGRGSILNIGSVCGHRGFAGGGSVYVGSKHAIEGISKCAALEGAAVGIRVNVVAPGHVETAMFQRVIGGKEDVKQAIAGMIPMGRVGDPKEIANPVLFVSSDKASFLTGEVLTIDGGLAAG